MTRRGALQAAAAAFRSVQLEFIQDQPPFSTGKERDAETGLDYFGFRYFSSAQGRWTSLDSPFADQQPVDPQSWNMYAYVRNNPLKNTAPNGRDCTQGLSACWNYVLGGLKGVANTAIGANNTLKSCSELGYITIHQLPLSRCPDASGIDA